MKKAVLVFVILAIGITTQAQQLQLQKNSHPKVSKADMKNNPLLQTWDTPYQTPPFDLIKEEHYIPAFNAAIEMAQKEIDEIANNPQKPDFQNTIVALERSGLKLKRIESIFFNMLSCNTTPNLQKMAEKLSPILSNFSNSIYHNEKLFKRIEQIFHSNTSLTIEERKLMENTYKSFVNNGAKLKAGEKERFAQLTQQLSILNLNFSKNVLESTNSFSKLITDRKSLKGIPENLLQIARTKAQEKRSDGYLFDLSTPSYLAIMKYADNRDLRKEFYMAYNQRLNLLY